VKVGARVVFVAQWSSFCGMRGVVVETNPKLMVRIDGDRCAIRVGELEVVEESTPLTLTGAE
jgi:hypothetical protein